MADLQQRTDAWYRARAGKLTASNLGAAIGVCSYTSRNEAFARATGKSEFVGNEATAWGNNNEANAIVDYQTITGNKVDASGLHVHKDYTWLAGSPDGLVGSDGMIEVKCPFYRKRDGSSRVHKTVPAHYYCQVNALLEILGRKWCDYISWTPEGMAIYRIHRDASAFDFFLTYYGQFYAAMAAGAGKAPTMSPEDKRKILARMASCLSDIDHDLWKVAVEDAHKGVRWPLEALEEEDEDEPTAPGAVLLRDEHGVPYVKRLRVSVSDG